MRKGNFYSGLLVLGLLILSGCNPKTPDITVTLLPTQTPSPTATLEPTPTPTSNPTPTNTPIPEVILEPGEVYEVPAGGFSFQSISGYETETDEGFIGIMDSSGDILISLFGNTAYTGSETDEALIDQGLESITVADFEKGEPYPISVGGVEGVAYDISGTLRSYPIEGQTFIVRPTANKFLFGLALAYLNHDADLWKIEGSKALSMVLESVIFITQEFSGTSACPVAADESYGYTEDNPIRVGGDSFGGPARERAYLSSLAGPNGEPVSFERMGSLPYGETILDIYEVSYSGLSEPVTLYVDEYSYEDLLAPVGFVCLVPIPLGEP